MAFLVTPTAPCVLFEDDHLLAVNKPAGMNTHAPSPFAGEGIYEWLRHREPRWASLAILHRLDKETSGVMLFGKTALANRSLTAQFTQHSIRKKYLLLTDRPVKQNKITVVSALVRAGERYVSRPLHPGADRAETHFTVLSIQGERTLLCAEPVTGRTHQIRVQAADQGFPILGDTLYGGSGAHRVHLHAAEIHFQHPATGEALCPKCEPAFAQEPAGALRQAVIDPGVTNAFRRWHGASDGEPGWYVEQWGDYLLALSENDPSPIQQQWLARLCQELSCRGIYHKTLNRSVRKTKLEEASPRLLMGEAAPEKFAILENGARYEVSFAEGYSVGLFLDQRDNRRRLLTGHVAADFPLCLSGLSSSLEMLNTFAYTCGFSVCAALQGMRTTSLDLSKKYLDWGRRNFALNGLDPAAHDFIYGDAFEWMRRLGKKGRLYDVIVLDPPTFSQSKERGVFRAEKDYGQLVQAALPLLKKEGVLLASTNAAKLLPEKFMEILFAAIPAAGRHCQQQHYVPQPPDFPVSRAEPAYLKTAWLRVG